MSIATSQQLASWFQLYKTIDVTYTKEVIRATGLDMRGVAFKCVGEQWPCVIYSSSFASAKVLVNSRTELGDKLKRANSLASIRFSFRLPDKLDPVSFFIAGKVMGTTPYTKAEGNLQLLVLQYTQRPPDDFIEILGRLLEANINSTRRTGERIMLSPDAMRRLCLVSRDSMIYVQGVPRKCILRDLSFSGAKVIIVGLAKFLVGKACTLRIEMDEPRESLMIKGVVTRYEDIEGRKDLTAIAVNFDPKTIPMSYKIHVNDFLGQYRQYKAEVRGLARAAAGAAAKQNNARAD